MENSQQLILSVLILAYNHEKYIAKTLESALIQKTNFEFEIVIGEDFSTDGTRAICEKYAKDYPTIIKLLLSEKNIGAVSNFLRTLHACTGKYVAICEGDDYWIDPYKLQKQVDFLENNPEYVLVHTNYVQFDTVNGKLLKDKNKKHEQFYQKHDKLANQRELFLDILFGNYFIRTCTAVFKKNEFNSILKEDPILFSNKFKMGDTQLFCEMALKGRIYYINESTALANKLLVSATNNPDPEQRFLFKKSGAELVIYLMEKHKFETTHRKSIQKYCKFLLQNSNKYHKREWADEVFLKYGNYFAWNHFLFYYMSRFSITRNISNLIYFIFFSVPNSVSYRLKKLVDKNFN